MNTNLLGNLEGDTPKVKIDNGNRRQGRSLHVLFMLVMMMGWGVSGAWGATVTYHIINLGRLDDSGQLTTSTRTEALRFTSSSLIVGLPNQYKSPLAKNWKYYTSDEITYDEETKAYTFAESTTLVEGTSVLSDGDHVYVTYEFDEEALSTVDLFDGGICKIKFLNDLYLKQTVWEGDPNTSSSALEEDSPFYWKVNIKDPYQITIQSQSTAFLNHYLSSKAGNFGDVRLRTPLGTAKTNKVWAFGLLPGGNTDTYRLIVTDGYTYNPGQNGIDQFGHGYLNNNDSNKTRYQKYGGSNYSKCDLTFVPLTKTYNIVNNSGGTLVQATTTDYPLEVPDVIKSPFASYTYYSTQADAIAGTNPINSVTSTTIYVRYTTSSSSLDLNGGTGYYVRTNDNYWYAASATTMGIESMATPSDDRKWTLNGNDAYQLTIQNVGNSKYVTYDVSSGEAVPTLSATGSKFFLHQSNTGQYEVVAITPSDHTTSYYSMGVANNTLKLYSNNNYPLGEAEVQSAFSTQAVCATPVITYDFSSKKVTITTSTTGATIYYTLTGENPDPAMPAGGNTLQYDPQSEPTVTSRTVVKAIAVKTDFINSQIARTTIVTNPTFQLAAGPYIYNRSAHTPLLHVNDVYGNTDLTDVIDPAEYTVTYSNNVNAGTATITITDNPDGDYIVNGSTTFTIEPMSIGTGGTPVSGITITVDSNGSEYLVTVKHGSVTLTEGESNDYTWQVTDSDEVTVTGHNNYTGSAIGHYVFVTPGYYALHKNNVGYLKRYSDNVTLGNENTFRYGNSFDNGSSIWIITPEGYLQSDYYYLNVANGNTLYLSVTPQTQWKTNDIEGNEHEKKQLKTTIGGVDYYLCNNNGTIQLTTNQTIAYNACPIAITEADENGWTGPTVNNITVQSPQQITYLRNCYFTQKMSYEFYDDGGTRKSEDNKDRRVFVKLTFNSSTDANQGTKWQVDASNGILYLKNTQTSEYTIPATYDVVPADPFVPAAHLAAVQTNISFKLQPKTIKPYSEVNKNYILFSIFGGDNFRYPYDTVTLQENAPVKPDGKGGTGNDSDLVDPDSNNGVAKISWTVEMDAMGFYSFKNSQTGRYLYFDENEYTYSDFGTLKVGSTSPSTDDTRYKFRFFKTSNSGGFGTCYYIIPYSKQFVVFKNDGVSASICAALNIADYSNQTTPVISLHQSVDNSKWLIYKYEAEYRVRNDFVLSGPSATYNTTDDNIFSTEDCWYGKCIKESPTTGNLQRSMVVSGSYNTTNLLNYIWTVDGLNDYISITGGAPSGTTGTTITINSIPTFNLDVTSLPVSAVTGTVELKLKGGDGGTHPYKTSDPKTLLFTIYGDGNVQLTVIHSLSAINDQFGTYQLAADANVAYSESNKPGKETFSGILDCNGLTVTGLTAPLFTTLNNGKVYNLNLKGVKINGSGPTGAIAGTANGASRIYNCGILPTTTMYDDEGNVIGFAGDTISSTNGYCGSIVGLLDGTARVINCFSYATIAGGSTVAGIVGYNNQTSTMNSLKTIVVNCMYYGEITGGTTTYPVYGGTTIVNNGTTAINNYNYYRGESTFDNNYGNVSNYNRSWPAEEKDLRRFEYYRSILNSNRRLCTWWVNGLGGVAPTDVDIANVGIAKWVLDPSKAPYPILKPWGKYPSIINTDTTRIWNWKSGQWVQRINAPDYQGKKLGELTITVKAGSHPMTLGLSTSERTETLEHVVITDMDTLNYDYCYGKVQLPYYNEVFGNSASTNHLQRYYGNYTDKVVTAWKITAVTTDGSVATYNSFVKDWEKGYNYADRYCKDKDIYSENDGRAFAQGGYYYVPVGVTAITIEAYWGDAFYLQGKDNALDRVSVCAYADNGNDNKNYGFAFTPAGTLPATITYGNNQSVPVYNDFKTLINAVKADRSKNVYEQAVVLVGNYPFQAQNDFVGTGDGCLGNTPDNNNKYGGFTFMSADFDMDNEPDFCFPFQWRNNVSRYPVMPIRFDFLPIPNLGLTMRHNTYAYAVGIMVPQGHFEMTETAFWYTTQFEPMSESVNVNHQQPLILNGGQYEQFVSHSDHKWTLTFTRNIIMGGHIWMKRFSPGSHAGRNCYVRHCAVSVMGGEFPEFYLTGIYWTDVDVSHAYDDNPHCYTNGGRFNLMAGAGMEAVKNSVYFEIDHSVIEEFYGGGINGNNPVNDSINVTINNSLVLEKYCGGPKIGESKAVTTYANNTVFCGDYFGGGNGGTNLYRQKRADQTPNNMPTNWETSPYDFHLFTPISNQGDVATYDADLGYHAEFEFEVFNQSNGVGSDAVARTYIHWAQFGTTMTKNVVNELKGCTVGHNFYGGGNLGTVDGTTISTLTDCTILGNAFGAGFSATIPSFPVHDKSKVTFPYRDKAGVCHNGTVGYRTDGMGDDAVVRNYTWCYKNSETGKIIPETVTEIPNGVDTDKPAFKVGDNWYCYTTKSLENLGVVTSNVTLTIKGKSTIGTFENGMVKHGTGNVFGGGDESAVDGSTLVKILDRTRVFGNIYGGGNMGTVGGDTKVIINGTVPEETPNGNANNNNPNH